MGELGHSEGGRGSGECSGPETCGFLGGGGVTSLSMLPGSEAVKQATVRDIISVDRAMAGAQHCHGYSAHLLSWTVER